MDERTEKMNGIIPQRRRQRRISNSDLSQFDPGPSNSQIADPSYEPDDDYSEQVTSEDEQLTLNTTSTADSEYETVLEESMESKGDTNKRQDSTKDDNSGDIGLVVKFPLQKVNIRSKKYTSPEPAADSDDTERIGDAVIYTNKKLGIGGFGVVYEGEWQRSTQCAVKVVLGQRASKCAQREAEVVTKIAHPNIVANYCIYKEEEMKTVFVMERMDLNLTEFLRSYGDMNTNEFQINACLQISSALRYLHSINLIHRDLSSNNILLSKTGDVVKVSDFGVSRFYAPNNALTHTLTSVPGTDKYMPPEAFCDSPTYDASLDIFSLGILIIQMITGLSPDPGDRSKVIFISPRKYKSGKAMVHINEKERRKNHIEIIPHDHPLRTLALECIEDEQSKRPTAKEIFNELQIEQVKCHQKKDQVVELDLATMKEEIVKLKAENQELRAEIKEQEITVQEIQTSFMRWREQCGIIRDIMCNQQ